jgi:hypothetical protein
MRLHFLLAALLFGYAGTAHATIVEALDLAALTQRAEVIVRGRAIRASARFDDRHERIFTDVVVRVDETYKGERARELVVRLQGGRAEGLGQLVIGEARIEPREEVVLFLRRVPNATVLQTVGMAQGKLRVRRAAGAAVVEGDAAGATRLAPGGGPVPALVTGRPLGELESELRRLAGAHP